jgi:hypothetical protein
MVFQNDILAGASGSGGSYQIDQSIRFNSADSSYLSRTPSSDPTGGDASGAKQFTVSVWLKRGKLSVAQAVFAANTSVNSAMAVQLAGASGSTLADQIDFDQESGGSPRDRMIPSALYRDVSAWYHLCLMVDTTQATAANRFKIAINGVLVSNWYTNDPPALDAYFQWNMNGVLQRIGSNSHNVGNLFDGYMAEFHNVDGVAAETSFGEFNDDGVWVPKAYTGTYGTNGFYITGEDSAALGTDYSGNGNDFTSSGLTAADQMLDTPTNNQITFNPLNNQRSGGTPSDGNLTYVGPGTRTLISLTANLPTTGKWAVAFTTSAVADNNGWNIGITKSNNTNFGDAAGSNEDVGASDGVQMSPSSSDLSLYDYITTGNIEPSLPITTSDEFWIAVDMATGKCFLGIYDASATAMKFVAADAGLDGNPATGDNPTTTITAMIGSAEYVFAAASKTSNALTLKRSTEVSGTTPTGYTYFENVSDFPTPAIKDGSAHFQTTLYTGNGTAIGSGGNAVTQIGNSTFQPDFVWMKSRSAATDHALYDAVRGTTKELITNSSAAESTLTEGLTTFGAAGFTVGNDAAVNTNAATYAAWQWKANGTGVANTDGTISSTVSVNQTAGFSIVRAASMAASGTIGHGLSQAPDMVIGRMQSEVYFWWTWHQGLSGGTYSMKLNDNTAQAAVATVYTAEPTSTVISTGASWTSGNPAIFYCFHEVEGFSKFGSYTGNGSADGPFVWCGFRPAFVLVKEYTSADDWLIYDSSRDPYNVAGQVLRPESSAAEFDGRGGSRDVDFLSNGFKFRSSNATMNGSGAGYIVMAFAEHPFGGDGVAPATAR